MLAIRSCESTDAIYLPMFTCLNNHLGTICKWYINEFNAMC